MLHRAGDTVGTVVPGAVRGGAGRRKKRNPLPEASD